MDRRDYGKAPAQRLACIGLVGHRWDAVRSSPVATAGQAALLFDTVQHAELKALDSQRGIKVCLELTAYRGATGAACEDATNKSYFLASGCSRRVLPNEQSLSSTLSNSFQSLMRLRAGPPRCELAQCTPTLASLAHSPSSCQLNSGKQNPVVTRTSNGMRPTAVHSTRLTATVTAPSITTCAQLGGGPCLLSNSHLGAGSPAREAQIRGVRRLTFVDHTSSAHSDKVSCMFMNIPQPLIDEDETLVKMKKKAGQLSTRRDQ